MKRTTKIFIGMVLLFLGMVNTLLAQPERPVERRGNRMEIQEPIERLADKLELSENQKAEIEALQLEGRKNSMLKQSQVAELQAQLDQLLLADNPDQDKISSIIDKMGLLRSDIQKERVFTRLSVRALLSDSQRIKFDMLHDVMPAHHRHMAKGNRFR